MNKHDVTPLMETHICKCGKLFESTEMNGLLCRTCSLLSMSSILKNKEGAIDAIINEFKNSVYIKSKSGDIGDNKDS